MGCPAAQALPEASLASFGVREEALSINHYLTTLKCNTSSSVSTESTYVPGVSFEVSRAVSVSFREECRRRLPSMLESETDDILFSDLIISFSSNGTG